MIRETQEET